MPIACTLDAEQLPARVAQWRDVAASATRREPTPAGLRLVFDRGVDVAALAALAHAEQQCCSFFTFTLTIAAESVVLDVAAPPQARPLVDALIRAG